VQGFALGVAQPLWQLHPVSPVFSLGSPGDLELRIRTGVFISRFDRGSDIRLKFALGRDKAVADATKVIGCDQVWSNVRHLSRL
jgi:hypothetical protein